MKLKRREKSEIVLAALFEGIPVSLNGKEYYMTQDNALGIKALTFNDSKEWVWNGEDLLEEDMSLKQFIKMCKELTDEEIAKIVCDLTITKIKL